jgi:queuine tRNA-ribosyltransferase
MLGPMLVSIHNITYYQRIMSEARAAIAEDRFSALLAERRASWTVPGATLESRVES